MQGGIRRKKDLLPRYKGSNGKSAGRFVLTTPMKKTIVYMLALLALFGLLRLSYSGIGKDSTLELEIAAKDSPVKTNANTDFLSLSNAKGNANADANPDAKKKVPKEQFNNEVAKQQEVKNLEKEYKQVPKLPVDNELKNKIEI